MIRPIAIRNETDYLNYLETHNNNKDHAVEFYCNRSNIIPYRGFCPNLIDLTIYINKYFAPIHLLSTIEMPQSLFHMSIVYLNDITEPDHVLEVDLPQFSHLSNLEYLRLSQLKFNNLSELPRNLKKLFIGDCEFAPYINRQIAQPGFLPTGIRSVVFTDCNGLFVLPLLPPTIKILVTTRTNADNGQSISQVYQNALISYYIDFDNYPQARRNEIIKNINARTMEIKKQRNISEVEDALISLHYGNNINNTYAVETETPEIKDYMGGRKKSKKQRKRRKNTRRQKR